MNKNPVLQQKKKIIILGAGFGGLACALKLGKEFKKSRAMRQNYELILIDRNNTHTYTPGLYEIASAVNYGMAPIILKRTACIPIENIISGLPIKFVQDEVEKIDAQTSTITLRDLREIKADSMVLAMGAITNFFNVPGAQEHGLALKTFADALTLHHKITEKLSENPNPKIIIAGGGATGVELSGELVSLIRHHVKKNSAPNIHIIEAGQRLLPGPPLAIAKIAQKRLTKLGVKVLLETKISAVQKNSVNVQTKNGEEKNMPFDIFIWSGGIKPNPILENITAQKDRNGKCVVNENLKVDGFDNIFAVGDLSCFMDEKTKSPLPATAFLAIGEGKIAAENILAEIKNSKLKYFKPSTRLPFIVPISGKWAAAFAYGLTFAGKLGFTLRLLADLRYFLKILPIGRAIKFFAFSSWTYFKND